MKLLYLYRQRGAGYSIEGLFSRLAAAIGIRPGYQVEQVHVPHLRIGPGTLWQNLRFARRQRATVYHITGDVHYLAMALPGKQTVLTIHDCISLDRLRDSGSWVKFRLLWLLFYYLPMRRVARIVTVSEKSRQELIRYMGPMATRVQVIPNHYDPRFKPHPKVFNEQRPNLLHIENGAHKNLHRVAQALADLPCRLTIIGQLSHEQHQQLSQLGIKYEQRTRLTDDEVIEAYKAADIVLFASLYEGFGLPILEANAIGRVVLTSAIAPLQDVAGEASLLVDPQSVESIRAGIRRLIDDPVYRAHLIEAGYRNAARYTVEQVADQYLSVYHSLTS